MNHNNFYIFTVQCLNFDVHDDADLGQVHLLHLLDEGGAHLCRAGGDGHAGGLQGGDLGAGCALVEEVREVEEVMEVEEVEEVMEVMEVEVVREVEVREEQSVVDKM